jgi:hypothetical protein
MPNGIGPGLRVGTSITGSPDGVETLADQDFDVRIGFGDGAEDLPPTSLGFDITDPHLQMPLAVHAAADKCRIQRHRDRCCRRFRPGDGLILKRLAKFQSVAA